MKEKESDIVKAICDYLEAKRHFFWRNNTGAFKTETGFYRFGAKGSPDIFVLTDGGYLISLEVKTKIGKLSPDQKLWQERCKEVGAEYHIVRSIDEVQVIGL